jgi:TRAP-type C4-dicarboxylate transport system substrate-binding protein
MTRLKTRLSLIATGLLLSLSAQAQTVTLKVHHFLPATSNVHNNIILPWCDKVAKESGDKLKCQIYPSMQLGGTPAQLFDQAKDGVADIVWTLQTYSAGRFTKSEVFELPFFTHTGKGSSQAFWEYVQKNALDEYKGVKPIFLHTHDGSAFHFSTKPVKSLEDFKGTKVRAASRLNSRFLSSIGATPVQMPLPAVPESMSKGVIDGAMVPWEGVPTVKLQEISKAHLDVPAGATKFANSIFVFAMNQAKYDALPADLKKVIDANTGAATSALAGEKFDAVVAKNHGLAKERGNAINVLSADEYKRFVKAAEEVDNGWIKEADAKGANGAALLKEARALVQQFDK